MVKLRIPKRINKAVRKEFLGWYREVGDDYFDLTQDTCPENSGQLKDSGEISHYNSLDIPWAVKYTAPYASDVEEGTMDMPNFDYTMKVKRHKRRLASGRTTMVRAHKKQYYNNQRPAKIDDTWAIITVTKREGAHWQKTAWANIRRRQDKSLQRLLPMKLTFEEQ